MVLEHQVSSDPIFFPNAASLRVWLIEHGRHKSELIVGFVKIHTGKAGRTWPQAVDEVLCVGWIDGVRTSIDENHDKIRCSSRKPRSRWSAVNIKRVPELEAAGRMAKQGLAAFARRTEARSSPGSYEQENFPTLSPSEVVEFKNYDAAWSFYEKLAPSYRRKVNWLIISAKQEAIRRKRYLALVTACAKGRREY